MLVPMTKVQIIGRRSDVGRMVDELHQLGLVEIADARSSDAVEELGGEAARSARRSELQPAGGPDRTPCSPWSPARQRSHEPATRRALDAGAARAELERLTPEVEALSRRLDALRDERLVLPELPGAAPAAAATRPRARRPRRSAAPASAPGHGRSRAQHRRRADRQDAPRRAGRGARRPRPLVWTRVDDGAIGCLVVFPHQHQQRGSAPCWAVRRSAGRSCPRRSSASRFGRPSRRCSAGWPSFRTPSRPLDASAKHSSRRMPRDCVAFAPRSRRARASRRARPARRDTARLRGRVLGAPARPGSPAA